MTTIEYSSSCLTEQNYREKIAEAHAVVVDAGYEFGVQIHNSISQSFLEKLLEYANDLNLSVHSPALAPFFLNLANTDQAAIERILPGCLQVLQRARSNILFFHGFFMCDNPIEHNMRDYRRVMISAMGNEFAYGDSIVQNPNAFNTASFAARKIIFQENMEWLQKRLPEIIVACENDFVGIGSGLQRPQEILELVNNVWFDTGHFWVSSLLHGFDFEKSALDIIGKKNIVGVHLHHNFSTQSDVPEQLRDSHAHLYEAAPQNLAPLVRAMRDKGVPRFCLEIVNGNLRDIEVLLGWLKS